MHVLRAELEHVQIKYKDLKKNYDGITEFAQGSSNFGLNKNGGNGEKPSKEDLLAQLNALNDNASGASQNASALAMSSNPTLLFKQAQVQAQAKLIKQMTIDHEQKVEELESAKLEVENKVTELTEQIDKH